MLSTKFICASKEYTTYDTHVPAPYIRKNIFLADNVKSASVTVCGLGFYKIFINGTDITKGFLAPYISNPDDILYYDSYDIEPYLKSGKNTISFILGNGMLNCTGGTAWDFQLARYRSAPKLAMSLDIELNNGEKIHSEADESLKTHPSPILFDDLRCGEIYDARLEIDGWNMPDFDDSEWGNVMYAECPRGEAKLCTAEPITVREELKPVSITNGHITHLPEIDERFSPREIPKELMSGYMYDFGINTAGNIVISLHGKRGQTVAIQFGEVLAEDGGFDLRTMGVQPHYLNQRIYYTFKGDGKEVYTPFFSYQGFRYALVSGVSKEQATSDLLTYKVMNSDINQNGFFECSDSVINKIQKAAVNADYSNFYYFPTDCPHREKNGWTADAALSAEQMLINMKPENSYHVWFDNIRKAQRDDGALPGIIPTTGYGFINRNGPAWDSVITDIPYYTWKYRGDTDIITENSHMIMRYLDYISKQRDENGIIHIGLGDWVPIKREYPKCPLEVTDTLKTLDICTKAHKMFNAAGLDIQARFASYLYNDIRKSARKILIESDGKTVMGRCQTSQAMAIEYNLFEPSEKEAAFGVLMKYLKDNNMKLDVGCIGLRVIFDVMSKFGAADTAADIISDTKYPSYGYMVEVEGDTALPEEFLLKYQRPTSKNHHFFGHVSAWFYKYLLGIKINPFDTDVHEVEISPIFTEKLKYAKGYIDTVCGKLSVGWERQKSGDIILRLNVPCGMHGYVRLPNGYETETDLSMQNVFRAASGEYPVKIIVDKNYR